MAKLERFSHRIGVAVKITARLFDAGFEMSNIKRLRPAAGPAGRLGMEPTLVEHGTPGTPDYRRVWTIGPPSFGASPIACEDFGIKGGVGGPLDGFEDAPAVPKTTGKELLWPDATLKAVAVSGSVSAPALAADETGDEHIVVAYALARKVRLRLNNFRVADECELDLPIEAFPFPPDGSILRSIEVEVRRGLIDADDWADAMMNGRAQDGLPLFAKVVSDGEEPDFFGFVDVHKLAIKSDGASAVTLTCRDMTSILADTGARGRTVEVDTEPDHAIARFLGTIPAMVGLEVVWVESKTPKAPGKYAKPKAKLSKKGKPLKLTQKQLNHSCLDTITEFCTLAGVVPSFERRRLVLRAYEELNESRAASVPRMVLGQNIEELELSHKMTGAQARAVECRSRDLDTGKWVIARWPDDPNFFGSQTPGQPFKSPPGGPGFLPPGAAAFDEHSAIVVPIANISDPARLREIARSVFEEKARYDVEGKIVTKDVATIEGRGKGVADLLRLRAGDWLSIIIAPSIEDDSGSYVQRLAAMPLADAVDLLTKRGWAPRVAARVAYGLIAAKRPLVYLVKEIEFDWSLGQATKMEITLSSAIVAIDRELRKRTGGNVAKLPSNASAIQKWQAIEDDMLAGQIPPAQASRLQAQAFADARGGFV